MKRREESIESLQKSSNTSLSLLFNSNCMPHQVIAGYSKYDQWLINLMCSIVDRDQVNQDREGLCGSLTELALEILGRGRGTGELKSFPSMKRVAMNATAGIS